MKKIKWIICNIPEVIAGTALIVMISVVSVNVILRYIFSKSLVWCEEVAAISFIWLIFVGAAACYRRQGLISIDILVTALPGLPKRVLEVLACLFMVIVNIVLCYLSLKFSLSAWTKLSLSLRIPYTYFDLAATTGFGFMSYYAVKDLIFKIKEKKTEAAV